MRCLIINTEPEPNVSILFSCMTYEVCFPKYLSKAMPLKYGELPPASE